MSILETNAVSKILHISNMEALCQAIKILRPRHYGFYFDSQTKRKSDNKNLGQLTKFNCQKVLRFYASLPVINSTLRTQELVTPTYSKKV